MAAEITDETAASGSGLTRFNEAAANGRGNPVFSAAVLSLLSTLQ